MHCGKIAKENKPKQKLCSKGKSSTALLFALIDLRKVWAGVSFGDIYILYFQSICYLRPSFSPSLLVVTQIGDHIADSSSPLPTTVRAFHFYREKISALSSLVDSRRIVLTHVRRSQQLILFYFCKSSRNFATAGFELTDQH